MLTKALGRLVRGTRIVSPRRGFYVVVPTEYSRTAGPPASWFIDDLMEFIGHPYYVGLLTAAAIHGAAHQQPQLFQVVTAVPLRSVEVGRAPIRFVKKETVVVCPTVALQTSTGTMRVSTPEVTAIDLVRYVQVCGHLSNVATVLIELAEVVQPDLLLQVLERTRVETAVMQRLGYLLEFLGLDTLADPLALSLNERTPRAVSLRPDRSTKGVETDRRWRIRINAKVEPDL